MHVPDLELHQPATLDEAAALIGRHGADGRLLAGGTDLLVDLKTGRVAVHHLVSLNGLDALRGITAGPTWLRVGALTTLSELGASGLVRESHAAILDAALQVAARQIRNLATVGGNLACAVPCADLPPILTAMGAAVTLWSAGAEREVPLASFYTGPRQTVRRDDEVLTSVRVPKPPPGSGAAYARFAQRDGNAIAVAAVAASVHMDSNGTVRDARVVLNAVGPVPKLVEEAAAVLRGRSPEQATLRAAAAAARAAAEPITDVRGSAGFRRDLVEVLARRALHGAIERAGGRRP